MYGISKAEEAVNGAGVPASGKLTVLRPREGEC
jgi:hypothetical protein